ncbi:MAG: hypothetical protein ACLPTJ_06055 [Solirubrobacteraceae bacterium]
MLRRASAFFVCWLAAGALYLLLIDITDLPELIVGAGAALLAAAGFELAREQRISDLSTKARWLGRLYEPLLRVPSDVIALSLVALRQLVHPKAVNGEFRAVRFHCGEDERLETGKWALAESFGSFAPNTIIVGVDPERELILGHQLRRSGRTQAIDVLELG